MTINVTASEHNVLALRPGDPGFEVSDLYMIFNRAAIEISKDCPNNVYNTLALAYTKGWIKPVAYIYESEILMTTLKG